MEIDGRIALVTGASGGLGAAIVEALVDAGAQRVYAAAREPRRVDARRGVVAVPLDVTDEASVRALASRCDVDVLVNNAGVSSGEPLLGASDASAAAREMEVNYLGTLRMIRAFAPGLAARGGGAIVNVLSILARVPLPPMGSYSASKAASLSLTQSVRAELAPKGTLVVGVLPGFIDTRMAAGVALPKLAPRTVAERIVHALRAGEEDVYPGPAAEIDAALRVDPKAVERRFAAVLAPR